MKDQELKKKWYDILKVNGFVDIEDEKNRLKHPDTRTIAFQNRGLITDRIDSLLEWLHSGPDIPERHRQILNLYCEGRYIKDIGKVMSLSRWTIRNVIKQYTLFHTK